MGQLNSPERKIIKALQQLNRMLDKAYEQDYEYEKYSVDYDKKCKRCKKPGASDSGYCLKCVGDIVFERLKKERDKKK